MAQINPRPLRRPPVAAADTTSPTAREHNNRGALLHLEGKLDEARGAYEAALAADPNNATATNNLGYLLAQQGRLEEAIEYYQRALELDPHKSTTFANLGIAQAALGQTATGIAALEKAVNLDHGNVLAWDNLGKVLLHSGRLAEAEHAWRSAIDLAPAESRFYTALGTAVAAQQRVNEAVSLLQHAVWLEPESATAWAQLGAVLFVKQDLGSAADALNQALALAPDDHESRHHLALLQLALGKVAEAERELERIVLVPDEANPVYSIAQIDLAVIALSRGESQSALTRLDAVLLLDPGSTRAIFYRALSLGQLERTADAHDLMQTLASDHAGKYAAQARDYLAVRKDRANDSLNN